MARVVHRWHGFRSRGPWLLLALPAVVATGCKSGTWGAKPSWWSFGGTPAQSSLAAAPTFEGDVTKPSEAAKPYPTTETPEGYALTDATRTASASSSPASPTASPTAATVDPTSVTYGSAPPPDAVPPPTATVGTPAPASSIGPQVGPYASLQPATPAGPAADPAAAATAGFAAAPAFGQAAPPADNRAAIAGSRYADARSTDAWAASASPPATTDSRYGSAYGSRFSSGGQPPTPPQSAEPAFTPEPLPAAGDPALGTPSSSGGFPRPSIDPATSSLQPVAPAATPPPAAGSDLLPGAIPPPKRRPDPGYRPGGTSSYRPNRAILAGDEAGGGVVPASFEAAQAAP